MAWTLLVLVPLLGGVALFAAAHHSRGQVPDYGLQDGRLRPCPATPNCLSSEEGAPPERRIAPLAVGERAPETAWNHLRAAIESTGGVVALETGDYLAATYRTPLFGFVDDFEARLDHTANVIHVRSASRVGRSDLGANRERVERIAARFSVAPLR